MNKGTTANILTQLGVTSDQFGLVTVVYTVRCKGYLYAPLPEADETAEGAIYCS